VTGYAQSLRTAADRVPAATIPVERIGADVVLVAGADDRVWDSVAAAERIAERRAAYGLETTVVTHALAGHRTTLPGEVPITGGRLVQGGSETANAALGELAWPAITAALRLRQP
jgi:hypothetical protein